MEKKAPSKSGADGVGESGENAPMIPRERPAKEGCSKFTALDRKGRSPGYSPPRPPGRSSTRRVPGALQGPGRFITPVKALVPPRNVNYFFGVRSRARFVQESRRRRAAVGNGDHAPIHPGPAPIMVEGSRGSDGPGRTDPVMGDAARRSNGSSRGRWRRSE